MNTETICNALESILPKEQIHENELMSRHTTFRIGGPASCLLEICNKQELSGVLDLLHREALPYFVLGNGSNLLVGDKGYAGIVIKLAGEFARMTVEGSRIRVGGAVTMAAAARKALDLGLTGLEFAAGIPGTVGGGMVMNAGAYGSDLSRVTEAVLLVDGRGEALEKTNAQMEFGYRTSAIKDGSYIVTEAVLALEPGNPEEIRRTMDELAVKRREKQPLEYPSAGSTFKRPEGYFAGELIMKAGLAGFRIGGAEVSKKHCGFVINTGGATASDVQQVICEVQRQVKHRFDVELEPEVIFLGEL